MSNFNNLKDPSAIFDSFNGTELKSYLKITTKYNEYGQTEKFELLELGYVEAISAVTQYENIPNVYIGFSRPSSIATGSSIVVGSITFSILQQGFIKELSDVFKPPKYKLPISEIAKSYSNSTYILLLKYRLNIVFSFVESSL